MYWYIFLTCWLANLSAVQPAEVEQANRLFDAGLFERTVPIYQALIEEELKKEAIPSSETRLKLAKSYFLLEQYSSVIDLYATSPPNNLEECYLYGVALRKVGNYEMAISQIQKFLAMKISPSSKNAATLELALCHFFNHHLQQAKELFNSLKKEDGDSKFGKTARLYLARMMILERLYEPANACLKELKSQLEDGDPLQYEIQFLLGEIAFNNRQFSTAIPYYTAALPKKRSSPWYDTTALRLGLSYLYLADDQETSERGKTLEAAETIAKDLISSNPNEDAVLLLAHVYFAESRLSGKEAAYEKAEQVLTPYKDLFSEEGKRETILLRAMHAPTYLLRDQLYRSLIDNESISSTLQAKSWQLRGVNDLEEAIKLKKNTENSDKVEQANRLLVNAVQSFQRSYDLFYPHDLNQAAETLKGSVTALFLQDSVVTTEKAFNLLDQFIDKERIELKPEYRPLVLLYGNIAAHLLHSESTEKAISTLERALRSSTDINAASDLYHHLGLLHYKNQNFLQAEEQFWKLVVESPNHLQASESTFWAARAADSLNNTEKSKFYRRYLYEKYPDSPLAPEAFFSFYNFYEYLQGDRTSLKHLQQMVIRYPTSIYSVYAWYLIGLDYKRDRKTSEGKWINKRNLIAAIDAFQSAESCFDNINKDASSQLTPFLTVRYRANLERALANLTIAEESQGVKRKIYLEYAIDRFSELMQQLASKERQNEEIDLIAQETAIGLAHALAQGEKDKEADQILSTLLLNYQSANITRSYLLSIALYDKAKLAMKRADYRDALEIFKQAEEAGKGKILDVEQKLDLWIQQSLCAQALGDYEQAILLLSKAVNEDLASSLRLKAIYLRAEAYQKFDRHEQARRQLEALAKLTGEWATKAKDKLLNDYTHHTSN